MAKDPRVTDQRRAGVYLRRPTTQPASNQTQDKDYFDLGTLKAQVLGTPTPEIREQMERMAGAG